MGNAGTQPVDVILVGAGHRSVTYAGYARVAPDQMRVVGVVDPNPARRGEAAREFEIPVERQFESLDGLPDAPLARAAINGTMDALHVPTSLVLLDKGYDLLLEKPISLDPESLLRLQDRATRLGRTVAVCHVLRHAPFYAAIRQRIAAGDIGRVLTIDLAELVSYDHFATAFVRGRWRSLAACGSTTLMAKCCHDLDLMTWFAGPAVPVRVTSAGSLRWFTEPNAPADAGTRCVVDCPIEATCPYSAKRLYVDQGLWGMYAWEALEHLGREATRDEKLASLAGDNPMGRCVWRCDNDGVDHQVVAVEFDDGATGHLTMTANAATPDRTIHVVGTRGEIFGSLDAERFEVRRFDAGPQPYVTETVSTVASDEMSDYQGHGGGDLRLVADFVALLQGREPSLSTTILDDSVNGHLIGFAADRARVQGRWVDLEELRSGNPNPRR